MYVKYAIMFWLVLKQLRVKKKQNLLFIAPLLSMLIRINTYPDLCWRIQHTFSCILEHIGFLFEFFSEFFCDFTFYYIMHCCIC